MSSSKKLLNILIIIVFCLGVVIGLALSGSMIWANFEASMFDPNLMGDEALKLHCPLMLTENETGTAYATFTNTGTWDVKLIVNATISENYVVMYRREKVILDLAPGESQEVRWTVSGSEKVFGRFVFVKAANNRLMPIPARVGTCGIVVVNIPFLTGVELVTLAIGLTILFLAAGMFLWNRQNRPLRGQGRDVMRSMYWLSVVIGADILCGVFGAWLPGIVAVVISVLLIVETLRHYITYS
jgi:hypothetical protein